MYILHVRIYSKQSAIRLIVSANGLRLTNLFENSTKIREYIILQNKMSPAIVDAFFDTLIDPTKVYTYPL